MPNYPTAAPIWPRVIEVPCTKTDTVLKCDGYTWQPKLGRGEYLFITPIITKEPEAVVKTVVIPGKTVYVEVPVKPKKQ
jgi:hypothetical protein